MYKSEDQAIICPDYTLLSVGNQAISWANVGLLVIGLFGKVKFESK